MVLILIPGILEWILCFRIGTVSDMQEWILDCRHTTDDTQEWILYCRHFGLILFLIQYRMMGFSDFGRSTIYFKRLASFALFSLVLAALTHNLFHYGRYKLVSFDSFASALAFIAKQSMTIIGAFQDKCNSCLCFCRN